MRSTLERDLSTNMVLAAKRRKYEPAPWLLHQIYESTLNFDSVSRFGYAALKTGMTAHGEEARKTSPSSVGKKRAKQIKPLSQHVGEPAPTFSDMARQDVR